VSLWFGYITFLWSKPAELQTLIQQQATKLLKVNQFKTIFEQAGLE
jgi:hypothetical protein